MDDTLLIRFLYTTKIGRVILKLLVGRNVSRFVGMFLNSRFSKFIIPHYIKKNLKTYPIIFVYTVDFLL